MPGQDRARVGFLTFDTSLHFYNMRSTLKQPQMIVVSDISDVFIPQPDDLLVDLSFSQELILTFLDSLPNYFQHTTAVDSCFVAAMHAGAQVIKSLGGKMIFFQVSNTIIRHPMLQVPANGNQPERVDLVNSTNPFFRNSASELAHAQITCDLFVFTH